MAERRPLVAIDGLLHELPAGDDLPPARRLDLPVAASGVTPQAVAVKVGGVWCEISWAAFLALIGSTTPPNEYAVTVGGVTVTANGEVVTVNDVPANAVTVGGVVVRANGEVVLVTSVAAGTALVNGEEVTMNGTNVKVTT